MLVVMSANYPLTLALFGVTDGVPHHLSSGEAAVWPPADRMRGHPPLVTRGPQSSEAFPPPPLVVVEATPRTAAVVQGSGASVRSAVRLRCHGLLAWCH